DMHEVDGRYAVEIGLVRLPSQPDRDGAPPEHEQLRVADLEGNAVRQIQAKRDERPLPHLFREDFKCHNPLPIDPPLTGGISATSAPGGTGVSSSAKSSLTATAARGNRSRSAGTRSASRARRPATVAPAGRSTSTASAPARSRARANRRTRIVVIVPPTPRPAPAIAPPAPASGRTPAPDTGPGGASACPTLLPSATGRSCTRSSRTARAVGAARRSSAG